MRSIIKAVCTHAYQQGWTDENIFYRCDFDQYKNLCVKSAPIKDRKHSDEDIQRMLDFIHEKQSKNDRYFPAYALEMCFYIALRRGELNQLKWSDLTEKGEITFLNITTELSRNNNLLNHTKTGKERIIPLEIDERIIDLLGRIKHVHDKYKIDSPYLFPDPNTRNGFLNYETVGDFYYRMLKKLNIPTSKDCIKGIHSLRRNFATNYRNKGYTSQEVSNMLGHSLRADENNYYTGGYDIESLEQKINRNHS